MKSNTWNERLLKKGLDIEELSEDYIWVDRQDNLYYIGEMPNNYILNCLSFFAECLV